MLESFSHDDLLRLCVDSDITGKQVVNLCLREWTAGSVFHIETGTSCWLIENEDPKKGLVSKLACRRVQGPLMKKSQVSGIREIQVAHRAVKLGIFEPIEAIYFMPKGSEQEREGVRKE